MTDINITFLPKDKARIQDKEMNTKDLKPHRLGQTLNLLQATDSQKILDLNLTLVSLSRSDCPITEFT